MKKITILVLLISTFMFIPSFLSSPTKQLSNGEDDMYLTLMGNLVDPTLEDYKFKDWKQTTIDYLNYVLNETNGFTDPNLDSGLSTRNAKVGRYQQSVNASNYFNEAVTAWGLPSYLGGNQPDNILGEGIAVLSAIMSGGLAGLDMTNYSAPGYPNFNYVKAAMNYYNSEGVFLNGDGTALSGGSFWYDLLPGVLFTVIASQYPSEQFYTFDALSTLADGWYKAVVAMGGPTADFYHLAYSIKNDEVIDGNHYEPDAAAGIAYILYSAYQALKNEGSFTYATQEQLDQYLEGAIWSMNYLDRIDFSPSYEIFQLFAPYIAARMNVEQNTNYNITKIFNDAISGDSKPRPGWGMIFDKSWGGYDAQGLMGAQNDHGGYAFNMGTFDAMMGFAPLVKYDKRYAYDVSRWVLAVSQSAQNFYPDQYTTAGSVTNFGTNSVWHGEQQSANLFEPTDPEASFIPYEGLRKYARYVGYDGTNRFLGGQDTSVSPYASGDAFSFNWGGRTDYGLYGASHVGTFSAISETNVEMILETDLDLLDIYSNTGDVKYKMYYNPHEISHVIEVSVSNQTNKLYNTITGEFLTTTVINANTLSFEISAGETIVTAELPSDAVLETEGINILYGDIVIAQNRAALEASLETEEGSSINPNTSVSGTIFADLNVMIPEGVNVTEIKVSIGNQVYYNSTTIPNGLVELDTTLATNGITEFVARVVLEGGIIERVSIPIRVVNMVITPAFEYTSAFDMMNQWNTATLLINDGDPLADHDTTATLNNDDNLVLTVNQGFAFGFGSSQDFYVDFTREPIFDIEILEVTGQYAVKFYVEGNGWHVSGEYLVPNTNNLGTYSFNLLDALKTEKPAFNPVGALKSSIHIGVVGNGASVTLGDFSVYHLYETPNLEEPDYTWGFTYHPAWLSMWSNSTSTGAIGTPDLMYSNEGEIMISSESGNAAIASKAITADKGQNPVIKVSPKSLTGSYYVGLKFVGNDTFYQLSDLITSSSPREFVITKLMEERYPLLTLTGMLNMQIMIGVSEGSELNLSKVETFYQLPVWGNPTLLSDWEDWETEPGYGDSGYVVDVNNRIVINNLEPLAATTLLAGFRGKFTVNFDYNPQIDLVIRAATGSYRILIQEMGTSDRIVIKDWGMETSRNPMTFNLNDILSPDRIYGSKSIYFIIEVLGGQKSVTVESLNSYYVAKNPIFGEVYDDEIATWDKGDNPSLVSIVNQNNLKIAQDAFGSNGVFTSLTIDGHYEPIMIIRYDDVKSGTTPYIKLTYQGTIYTITPDLTESMTYQLNIKEALGITSKDAFNVAIEIGASGVFFEIEIDNIEFIYQLGGISNTIFDRDENTITWDSVLSATSYYYEVRNQNQEVIESGDVLSNTLLLDNLSLAEGVYNVYIYAKANGYQNSLVTRVAILQGDVESVELAVPADLGLDGTVVSYGSVDNVLGYYVEVINADTDEIIFEGLMETTSFDLIQFGFPAFNYTINIYSMGDGLVYLDSAVTTLEFHTNPISYYSAFAFSTMNIGNNNTSGVYNESLGYTELVIGAPGSTWGSVSSIPVAINFDNNPVLYIDFDESSTYGYFLQINIGGTNYYLADDTFDFSDVYLDINAEILSRTPGAASVLTGTKNATINFGTTSGNPTDVPSARYREAYIYELTTGHGEAMLGQLATPEVTINGKVASWDPIPNATSYVFILKNEVGTLIQKTITDTNYDFSIILAGGEYEVNVIAKGNQYFDSESGIKVFTLDNDIPNDDDEPKGEGLEGWQIAVIAVSSSLVVVGGSAAVFFKFRKPRIK